MLKSHHLCLETHRFIKTHLHPSPLCITPSVAMVTAETAGQRVTRDQLAALLLSDWLPASVSLVFFSDFGGL